jgi:hypothetical protein
MNVRISFAPLLFVSPRPPSAGTGYKKWGKKEKKEEYGFYTMRLRRSMQDESGILLPYSFDAA